MRICFNAHRLAGQRLGVGRYIEYMLRYWSGMLEDSEEVVVFLRRAVNGDTHAALGLSKAVQFRVLNPDLPGILWENVRLRGPATRLDVLFCPAYTAPVFFPGPLVVATHSVNERYPGAHSWWHRQSYGRLYRHCARRADVVIVPCETTRADVEEFYGVRSDRIRVVPQGADPSFRPIRDDAVLRAVRQRFFGGNRPFILFVGKCSVRRNIPMLLEAFAQLRGRAGIPHGLLLFGPNPADLPLERMCQQLGISDAVVQTEGRVAEHADLVPIYSAAEVFVHPSEYEGWSMTTVEAMACGTAVVAADRGGLGDLARGHALMVEKPSVAALAEAIGRVLDDQELRRSLQQRALARGAALRWEDTTRDTLQAVRTAGNG